jgi:hypothetical protein
MMMYPEVTLADSSLCWSGVDAQGSPNSTKAHLILIELAHQEESPRSTIRPLMAITNQPRTILGKLHNLIGVSQVIHKATKLVEISTT